MKGALFLLAINAFLVFGLIAAYRTQPQARFDRPYKITMDEITPAALEMCRQDYNCMDIETF